MNAKQSNKLSSLDETHVFVSTNPAALAIPALAPRTVALKAHIASINQIASFQALPTGGPAEVRDKASDAAIELALAIAGPALCFAKANDRAELALLVDLSRTDFLVIRKGERMRLALRVLDAARPLAVQLEPFGVTAAMLADLEAKIDASLSATPGPRTKIADRKAATDQLAKAFKAADQLLIDEIDPLVEVLRTSAPGAYVRYQIARQIIDRPGVRGTDEGDTPTVTPPAVDTAVLPKAA